MENPEKLNQPLVLRKRTLCKLLAISPAHLDRMRVRGEFPKPIRLGEQAVGWTAESIQEWLANRPMAQHYVEMLAL